jgi:hypothetical protein
MLMRRVMLLLMKKEIHCSKDKMPKNLEETDKEAEMIKRFSMIDRRWQMYKEHLEDCFYFSTVSSLISLTGIQFSLEALKINSIYNDSSQIINTGLLSLVAVGIGTVFHNIKKYFDERKPPRLYGEELYLWLERNYKLPEEISQRE